MSVSSGSSLCGDTDQDLLLDDEEEIDFYAVLNVPRDVILLTSFSPTIFIAGNSRGY